MMCLFVKPATHYSSLCANNKWLEDMMGSFVKPVTHHLSLCANNDNITFLRKKLGFATCDEKRSTHYLSQTPVFANVCSNRKYEKKFFEFVKKPPTLANTFHKILFRKTLIWQITPYTLFAFCMDFIRLYIFRHCSRIVCRGLKGQLEQWAVTSLAYALCSQCHFCYVYKVLSLIAFSIIWI